jgi:hypothetical protein
VASDHGKFKTREIVVLLLVGIPPILIAVAILAAFAFGLYLLHAGIVTELP